MDGLAVVWFVGFIAVMGVLLMFDAIGRINA